MWSGPICETGDFFARDRELPSASTKAICSRFWTPGPTAWLLLQLQQPARPPEVLIDGKSVKLIRRREIWTICFGRKLVAKLNIFPTRNQRIATSFRKLIHLSTVLWVGMLRREYLHCGEFLSCLFHLISFSI